MPTSGQYADGTLYDLPNDWRPLKTEVLQRVKHAALDAVTGSIALDNLRRFYNRDSEYAGTSFIDIQPNSPSNVEASDLFAVSRLSIRVANRQSRLLLDNGVVRDRTAQILAGVPPEATISDRRLGRDLLSRMYDLQNHFRQLLSTDENASNHWVFAAKLCARKRPQLFPVRDSVVCRYLSGGQLLASAAKDAELGRLGWFSNDIQAFAYLATNTDINARLSDLTEMAEAQGIQVDNHSLRLLDVLLWMKGRESKLGAIVSST